MLPMQQKMYSKYYYEIFGCDVGNVSPSTPSHQLCKVHEHE